MFGDNLNYKDDVFIVTLVEVADDEKDCVTDKIVFVFMSNTLSIVVVAISLEVIK